MRASSVRLDIAPSTWAAMKAEARRQRVPATVLTSLLIQNYTRKHWPLELIPEKRIESDGDEADK